jgi:hypothetical protein
LNLFNTLNEQELHDLCEKRYVYKKPSGELVLRDEAIGADIDNWMNKWLGFNWFAREWMYDAFESPDINQMLVETIENHPQEEWEGRVLETVAMYLGWNCLKYSMVMDYLIEKEQEIGLGKTLEHVANTPDGYKGILLKLSAPDDEPIEAYSGKYKDLYNFTINELYGIIVSPLNQNEEMYQAFTTSFERGDTQEIIDKIFQVWISPIFDKIIEGVFFIIGYYAYLKTKTNEKIQD